MGKINGKFIIADSLVIDFDTHRMWNIKNPDQKENIKNTPYNVLETMWLNKNEILSKEVILTTSWGPLTENDDSVVKDNISKLNRLTEILCPDIFEDLTLIKNIKGTGYIIDECDFKIRPLNDDNNTSNEEPQEPKPREFTQNIYGGVVVNSPGEVNIIEHVDTINI